MTAPDPDAYPTRIEDVTADWLCRHLVKAARESARRIDTLVPAVMDGPNGVTDHKLFAAENAAFVKAWGIVAMLRDLLPEHADYMARMLWSAWQDGAHLHEMLYEWAREYGQET